MQEPSERPVVSVVIVNYNGRVFLENCLTALDAQTYRPFEVILVDNASTDDSVRFVETRFPTVRLFPQKKNLGFAGGTNAGIREARGEYILTLNPDTIPAPGFIEELVKPFSADPGIGMGAARMLLPDGRINSTGICISRSGAAWDRGMNEPDRGQFDTGGEVFGPCGGAALYRRLMLDEIGLFDEDFFLYMEDVDLAFRGRLAGWRCVYIPGARIMHIHCGSTREGSDLAVYYGNRNIIWVAAKNFPRWFLITSLPWIIGRNLVVVPYYAMRGQGRVILRAKYDAVRLLGTIMQKRAGTVVKLPSREISAWIRMWAFGAARGSGPDNSRELS